MAYYSIKDLENFTSIKAHTIRIWEQRYNLLNPKRTETNIRYYSDKDLKKILNINLLYNQGYKISKIAKLSESEIFEEAANILNAQNISGEQEVERFIRYITDLDEKGIHDSLHQLANDIGVEDLYRNILIPLLEKVGVLWQVNTITVSHEHFFSNILREFFIVKIESLTTAESPKGKVILFLPEHERHEISLLFYYYILKSRGYECYYLGQCVPHADLKMIVEKVKPDYLFSSLIAELSEDRFIRIMQQISELIHLSKLYVGGFQIKNFKGKVPAEINTIQGFEDILI